MESKSYSQVATTREEKNTSGTVPLEKSNCAEATTGRRGFWGMGRGGGARRGMWMEIGAVNGGSGEANKTLRREAVGGSQAAATVMAMANGEGGVEESLLPLVQRCAVRRCPEVRTDGTGDRAEPLARQRAELEPEPAWFQPRARL